MKCEKCGKEATFHYQSNINGEVTEYNLCNDCARAEGFGETIDRAFMPSFGGFFGRPSLLESFFGESPFSLGFGRALAAPTLALPWINVSVGDRQPSTKSEEAARNNIPEDAGEEIRAKRELVSLRQQLQSAVADENYERAIELRDQIKKLAG
ncbi:MAG: UvrB/UvrC motif-containing protein [Oscillospiraceae bacterium]|jgi:protein arginine kinase activator|nr:UvrB/UvrC motif-containing protein [Oscillospiraceae bacterium]